MKGRKSPRKGAATARRYHALQDVAVQLIESSTQQDLLHFIVNKAMDLLCCDAGSLYLRRDERTAVFAVAFNRSVECHFEQTAVPLGGNGIAAYVFRTGREVRIVDAYRLPPKSLYRFDKDFDARIGYRTRSILALPLVSSQGELLGVLQLINRKHTPRERWPIRDEKQLSKFPRFSEEDSELMRAFAALAAASIEKANLIQSIDSLFKGFIRASVQVIEERDPATKGHSERVASLTVGLARRVSESRDADVRSIVFSDRQLEELHYASLLHDFGKVSIREAVLLKANKLYADDAVRMRARFDHFAHAAEAFLLRQHLAELMRQGQAPTEFSIAQIEKRIREKRGEIEKFWADIMELNRPTVLSQDKSELLDRLRHIELLYTDGTTRKLLESHEIKALSITKGSLSPEERQEVESHVTSTYHFLQQIPWTRDFASLPEIAYCHHEKLDGTGYPRRLKADQIPVQSRIMTICDIFDALVAADRPYKKALPPQTALQILDDEAKRGQLDTRFLRIFVESKLWEGIDFSFNGSRKRAAS